MANLRINKINKRLKEINEKCFCLRNTGSEKFPYDEYSNLINEEYELKSELFKLKERNNLL